MSTDLILPRNLTDNPLTADESYGLLLQPASLTKHKAWIGVRVEALLDSYWDRRPGDAEKVEIIGDWLHALSDFTPQEIRAACREWLEGDERHKKPKPGDIVAMCKTERRNRMTPEQLRELHDRESRDRIAEFERRRRARIGDPEPPRVEPSDESKQRVQEMVDNLVGKKRAN